LWAPAFDIWSAYSWLIAFGAALAGGLHCAGMCGPLRLLAAPGSRWQYQGGRLGAYLTLGLIGGITGASLPIWIWLPVALLLLLASFFGWLPNTGWKKTRAKFLSLSSRHPIFLGLASALLPCGLLHAWVAVAAATANPISGAVLLSILWAGSLPALELPALALGKPIKLLRVRFPLLVPVVFILLAMLPLLMRMPGHHNSHEKTPACHETSGLKN